MGRAIEWGSLQSMTLALPWFIGGVLLFGKSLYEANVATRERSTTAVITLHEVHNHNQYRYQFDVDGQQFTGLGYPPTHVAGIGEKLPVYYDEQNPSTNALQEFAKLSAQARSGSAVFLIGSLGVIGALMGVRLNRKGKTTWVPRPPRI